MLRLPHQFAAAYAASQLQWLSCFRLLHTNPEKASSTAVPEQWLSDFNPTEPLPPGYSSDTTAAFGWARKQAPQLSLAQLGKLFRQRQVRVVQQGQVKRVSRARSLLPGDVLLLPKQLQQHGSRAAAAAAAVSHHSRESSNSDSDDEGSSSWAAVRQQQQQQLELKPADQLLLLLLLG